MHSLPLHNHVVSQRRIARNRIMKTAIAALLLIFFTCLGAEEFFVDINSGNPIQTGSFDEPFHSITEAIENICSELYLPSDGIAIFSILPGTYEENISIQNNNNTSIINEWQFQAYDGNVKLIGDSPYYPLIGVYNMWGANITFLDIEFFATSEQENVAFRASVPNRMDTLKFNNCSFSCFHTAILITEPTSSTEILEITNFEVENCIFEGIQNEGYGIYFFARNDDLAGEEYTFVRDISIHNNSFSDSAILQPNEDYTYDCITIRNWRKDAPAYKIINIFENTFENSTPNVIPYGVRLDRLNRQWYMASQVPCKAFVYDNVFINHHIDSDISKLTFTNNKAEISDNTNPPFLKFYYLDTGAEVHSDTLWTEYNIIRAPKVYDLYRAILLDRQNSCFGNDRFMSEDNSSAYITNSLACGYGVYFASIENGSVYTTHSYYDTQEDNDLVSYENCLFDLDLLISDHSTGLGYSLLWDNDNRSPLIMAGLGATEAISQPNRYDLLDIGAVQYDEHPHEYITYSFLSYVQRNGLKWMSFPTLDRIWNPTTGDPDQANTFFLPIRHPSILQSVSWKVLDHPIEYIQYVGETWVGDDSHSIIPQQGYKLQMASGLQDPQSISEPGIIPQTDQYPLNIIAQATSKAIKIGNPNWLGYFHDATVNPYDAFADIIDNLWSIQTQNWTMVREQIIPGSRWITALQYGKEPTLSYGDMVIVKCFNDAQFYWNTAARSQIPIEKELPDHFEYEEKADYIPFYVELGTGDLPREIALYMNDVCKGTAVVCDSLVEIPGYIVDDLDPNSELEIRAYYESKSAVDQIPEFTVWNQASGSYEHKPLILSNKNYYYKLKLSPSEGESPAAAQPNLKIYPNPFNPSTTIKFSLPETGKIRLDIYNLKGQLVRNLAKGEVMSGMHSAIWDGTDNNHQAVSSGLYYSKLSYQNKSFVKKMILLK